MSTTFLNLLSVLLVLVLVTDARAQNTDLGNVSKVFGPAAQKKMGREEAAAARGFHKAFEGMTVGDQRVVQESLGDIVVQELVGPVPITNPPKPKPTPITNPPKPKPNCMVPNPKGEILGPLPGCASLLLKKLDGAGIVGRYPVWNEILGEGKGEAAIDKVIGSWYMAPTGAGRTER